MIVINTLVIVVFAFAIFITYLKIRYPFWSSQPVLHSYDLWRKLGRKPYIVYPNGPVKTKFCDFENVKTVPFLECSQQDISQMENIIQCYYMPTERIMYTMSAKHLAAFFTGGREPSMISFYNENKYTVDETTLDIKCSPQAIGIVSSRYLQFHYLEGEHYREYPLYYIDFLSVHRERDYTKICRHLIQTHEYNQRVNNPNVQCSLIKKEIELFPGVVPLVQYNTTTYNLRNNKFPLLPEHCSIIRVKKENISMLHDFLYTQTKTDARIFDVCIFPDIGSMVEQMEQNLLYIYCLHNGEDVYGYYFFKDVKTVYEIGGDGGRAGNVDAQTLHCVTSFANTRDERFFYLGFLHALHDVVKYNRDYKMLLFDEIGHNVLLYRHWRRKYTPIFTTPTAYYTFNLIFPVSPVNTERVFLLT